MHLHKNIRALDKFYKAYKMLVKFVIDTNTTKSKKRNYISNKLTLHERITPIILTYSDSIV